MVDYEWHDILFNEAEQIEIAMGSNARRLGDEVEISCRLSGDFLDIVEAVATG
jgi:hypothetical protein